MYTKDIGDRPAGAPGKPMRRVYLVWRLPISVLEKAGLRFLVHQESPDCTVQLHSSFLETLLQANGKNSQTATARDLPPWFSYFG